MKFTFILNPTSGTRRNPQKIAELIHSNFKSLEHDYDICYTEYPQHASEIAREQSMKKTDVVVAIGGDGTVNEVAEGLIGSESALAIIPVGSGNGFARHFKIPLKPEDAIASLPHYRKIKIDTGRINGHHFNGVCGMGFDAYVSQKFHEEKTRGLKTYVKIMFREYFRFKPDQYVIRIDDETMEMACYTLTIANAPEYGNGAVISPNSVVDDGKLEVCAMKPLNFFKSIGIAYRMLNGTLDRSSQMSYFPCETVTIERKSDPTIHVDGTPLTSDMVVKIEIVKQSLHVMVP